MRHEHMAAGESRTASPALVGEDVIAAAPAADVADVAVPAASSARLDGMAEKNENGSAPEIDSMVPSHALPQNWSSTRRWLIVLALSLTSLMVYVPGPFALAMPARSALNGHGHSRASIPSLSG